MKKTYLQPQLIETILTLQTVIAASGPEPNPEDPHGEGLAPSRLYA